MEGIGYGILIAALMGLSSFAAAWVVLKLNVTPNWQPFSQIFGKSNEDEEELMKAAQRVSQPANYDEPPGTAEEEASKYVRRGAFEELKDATKGRT